MKWLLFLITNFPEVYEILKMLYDVWKKSQQDGARANGAVTTTLKSKASPSGKAKVHARMDIRH